MRSSLILLALATIIISGSTSSAATETWLTDFDQAKKTALEKKQPILAVFSGSDWCSWCMKLDKEILSKDDFKKYAKDNLVLFLADFPSSKKLPEATEKQNKQLAEKYNVEGFPTVLIINGEGKVLAKTGYLKVGPAEYVENLKKLISNK